MESGGFFLSEAFQSWPTSVMFVEGSCLNSNSLL